MLWSVRHEKMYLNLVIWHSESWKVRRKMSNLWCSGMKSVPWFAIFSCIFFQITLYKFCNCLVVTEMLTSFLKLMLFFLSMYYSRVLYFWSFFCVHLKLHDNCIKNYYRCLILYFMHAYVRILYICGGERILYIDILCNHDAILV